MGNRSNNNAMKQQNGLMQQQLNMQRGIVDKQSALSNTVSQFARQQHTMAGPAMGKALDYYMNMAGSGGNGALQQAMAPQISMINQQYGGAEKGMLQRMAPGAQRDQAIAGLYQQRAGQIGQAGIQGRTNAVGQLAGMGQNLLGNSLNAYGTAAGALSGAQGGAQGMGAQQLGHAQLQNQMRLQSQQGMQNMGMNIGRILLPYILGQQGGGATTHPTNGSNLWLNF